MSLREIIAQRARPLRDYRRPTIGFRAALTVAFGMPTAAPGKPLRNACRRFVLARVNV
ncbi:hypothetical protein CERSUDRAFT_118950 [Gelatoporia subvermispora B]|uniref:Uncharacterized protein n=1 Tax=Ceriporiopsis subvermispora (strain B) TaxID=914234 RepID=M2R1X7_CERS8|nr:hypothetical protein CERSUDRAFT_118950 [Gelatoporia subvermispora B]